MKIAVLGANGRSGRIFVQTALEAGHSVRAGVHQGNPFTEHARLEVISCDATNIEEVKRLINGTDVVVSLIGHTKQSAPDVQTQAIQAVVDAMQPLGLRRLISLTGTGVRMPGDVITLLDRLSTFGITLFDRKRVADGRNHAKILMESNLEWTILRVLKLENNKPTRYTLLENGPAKTIVSRHEVASAILEILETNQFIRKAPIISSKQRGEPN